MLAYYNLYKLTYFKINQKWSVIDPYYGFYFINENNNFCSIEEHKTKKCFIRHLNEENIKDITASKVFKNKNLNIIKTFTIRKVVSFFCL